VAGVEADRPVSSRNSPEPRLARPLSFFGKSRVGHDALRPVRCVKSRPVVSSPTGRGAYVIRPCRNVMEVPRQRSQAARSGECGVPSG
jgi:hypothetical protein